MSPVSERDIVYFHGDRTVSIRTEPLPAPEKGAVQVETHVSAISVGTERLVYEGNVPEGLAMDASIDALQLDSSSPYPMPYGYAAAGVVIACGSGVDASWLGRRVFSFQPHATHFNAAVSNVTPIPEALSLQQAVSYPNIETAVGLVMDGRPMIGERVAVFGMGVVGLLTVRCLAAHPLSRLVAIDPISERREAARTFGATNALAPNDTDAIYDALDRSPGIDPTTQPGGGADLVFELSGRPDTLNDALDVCGYGGRIIVGSWYGTKRAPIDLGGRFHRSHATLRASQVSTIGPEHRARWTHDRRRSVVWSRLNMFRSMNELSEPYRFHQARATYELIAHADRPVIQPLHVYNASLI